MIVGRDSGTLSAARIVKHVKQLQVRAVFTQVVNIPSVSTFRISPCPKFEQFNRSLGSCFDQSLAKAYSERDSPGPGLPTRTPVEIIESCPT